MLSAMFLFLVLSLSVQRRIVLVPGGLSGVAVDRTNNTHHTKKQCYYYFEVVYVHNNAKSRYLDSSKPRRSSRNCSTASTTSIS
jgi:hypothetical protein